jgi:Raf kinase inhibitor-like YbhB/YbcL family protein
MKITTSAFKDSDYIPEPYSREGGDRSPPISIDDVPSEAKSLAIIMDDPDAPKGTFTHWIVFNIDPNLRTISEGTVPQNAVLGKNDWGQTGYGGPRPPSGTHRYYFHVYALDCILPLKHGATRSEVEKAIEAHVVANTVLMGKFSALAETADTRR